MTSLKQSILATLTYSDHFDYPLTLTELHSRLIQYQTLRPTLKTAISKLLQSDQIIQTDSYYHLPTRQSLVKLRQATQTSSRIQRKLATQLISRISSVPGIMAIYLTGSLAVGNSMRGDDIDLMIITKRGRLWTTRLLLTLYTQLLGLRRRPNPTTISNKLCLNLYLDNTSLEIPSHLHSLYTAYELIQAIPIYDFHHTHPRLLQANSWILDYLPNFLHDPGSNPERDFDPGSKRFPRSGIVNSIYNFLESLAYYLQLRYMRSKITREYITPTQAFFHPNNPGKSILSKLDL